MNISPALNKDFKHLIWNMATTIGSFTLHIETVQRFPVPLLHKDIDSPSHAPDMHTPYIYMPMDTAVGSLLNPRKWTF